MITVIGCVRWLFSFIICFFTPPPECVSRQPILMVCLFFSPSPILKKNRNSTSSDGNSKNAAAVATTAAVAFQSNETNIIYLLDGFRVYPNRINDGANLLCVPRMKFVQREWAKEWRHDSRRNDIRESTSNDSASVLVRCGWECIDARRCAHTMSSARTHTVCHTHIHKKTAASQPTSFALYEPTRKSYRSKLAVFQYVCTNIVVP